MTDVSNNKEKGFEITSMEKESTVTRGKTKALFETWTLGW